MNVLGPRIRLRPTRHDDLPFLQAMWNDGTVMQHKGYPHGMDVTTACMERWWETTPQSQQLENTLPSLATPHCMIELLDGTPIGELSYSLDAHKRAHVDLKLANEYWHQGYATEALILALRELFATTGIVKVLTEPTAENDAAHKLYKRCGFQPMPTENHPYRWECTRVDFADRNKASLAEVA
jgi:RimJ/RimL family protein N-acetyltransferase